MWERHTILIPEEIAEALDSGTWRDGIGCNKVSRRVFSRVKYDDKNGEKVVIGRIKIGRRFFSVTQIDEKTWTVTGKV